MSARSPLTRLSALEHALSMQTCQTCYGHPSRIVTIDLETNAEIGETMPAGGCPECGRPIQREYRIIGMSLEELP